MAEISDYMSEWWGLYQPDPRANYEDIVSGMRAQALTTWIDKFEGGKTEKITKYQLQTGSCQYWIKGLSAVCGNWNSDTLKCALNPEKDGEKPSGYGIDGSCDRLGRRGWCSMYIGGEEKLNEFVCIAPCFEKSGLGKQITTETKSLVYRPVNPDEIKGYNPENGVGRCDGWGMGRGNQGPFQYIEDVYDKRPLCNYYRPQQMGFGAMQPRPFHGSEEPGKPFDESVNWIPTTPEGLHDGSKADPLTKMDIRLPFSFQVYNCRAMYQKCAHWNGSPAFFEVDYIGSDPSMFSIIMNGESLCECEKSDSNDYKNIVEDWPKNLTQLLVSVWAPYGGIVCNGAKPECPCYSGKWIYCTDENFRDGMRITADQIFELRFWASDWASQAEYDAYYLQKPGPTRNSVGDNSTSKIYTFTHWEKLNPIDSNESEMIGKIHSMCMPAPLNMREFDAEVYIKKEPIRYPKLNATTGSSVGGKEVFFPTLVRELENPTNFVPDILIVYPYATIDPWNIPACNDKLLPDYCYHDTNLMDDQLISVVGRATANKTVYVINIAFTSESKTSTAFNYLNNYIRANQIPGNKWRAYCESVQELIDKLDRENTALFYSSTDDFGFFEVQRVKLKIDSYNTLYILCEYNTGDYSEFNFRKLNVQSRYWAGLIEQYDAAHIREGDVWYNEFPLWFEPGYFNVAGYVHNTRGVVQTVFSTYALYVYGTVEDIAYYSYCINEYSDTEVDVKKWTQVGATGYIWAEIDSVEISYLWNFAVTKATIQYNSGDEESKEKVFFCGIDATEINLEIIYPEPLLSPGISIDRNAQIIRRSIPPNAVLLKAPEPMPFFNSDWTLNIDYTYQKLENFLGEKVVWPYNMGVELGSNMFAESPYQILHAEEENEFQILEVGSLQHRGSLKVMAYLADGKGRIQAGVSTKFLLQGYNAGMRSVDIHYRYAVDAKAFDLQPALGFFTWRGSPAVAESSEPKVHSRDAKCGDHECNSENCIGPVWFPFNNCTTVDFYDVTNPAADCTMAISEGAPNLEVMGYAGWRYVIADEYNGWVTLGGNWASSCGSAWYYHYSQAGDTQRFVGKAKKKAKVDKWYYLFMGWALPPFGNKGRGFVERYITRDFATYLDLSGQEPMTGFEYMPMVFDKEDLFADLNPFSNPDEATPLHEPFSHFSMLSNYTAEFIGENVSTTRYGFDDIIKPVYHGNCMYPHPVMGEAGMTRVIRYGFKNENHVWAWPEFWKPLERNKSSDQGQFRFLDVVRPEYYFDYNKAEHRLITDEGTHLLIFSPPEEKSDEDSEEDSKSKVYPSIALDGKFPRYFKLLYEDYSSENIEWKDEATTGEEGASGGDGEEGANIYEAANNGAGLNGLYVQNLTGTQWLHDFNTIFDDNASPEPNEDRKAYLGKNGFTGEDVYLYYNRGLIAFLPRNRLQYLPISLSDAGPPTQMNGELSDETLSSLYCFWDMSGNDQSGAPLTIKITGYWGIKKSENEDEDEDIIYSMPGVQVIEGDGAIEEFDENEFPKVPEDSKFVDSITSRTGEYNVPGDFDDYEIEFELPRIPDRIVGNTKYFFAIISAAPGGEVLKINNITAEIGKYVRAEEEIFVHERRYRAGTASLPEKNADGPDTELYRSYERDRKNAGQYFPFEDKFATTYNVHEDGTFLDEDITDFEEGGKVISKLTMVGFTKIYREDEVLDVTMSNLKEIELEPQHQLHIEAFERDAYDDLNFMGVTHPAVGEWLKSINVGIMRATNMKLTYKKVDWEHNQYKNLLNQEGDFISPGGHYFVWNDEVLRTRCYIFGPVQSVYFVDWMHYKHGKQEATWTPGWAYEGWGRLEYYNGKLAMLGFLGQSEAGMASDALSGAKNYTPKRS